MWEWINKQRQGERRKIGVVNIDSYLTEKEKAQCLRNGVIFGLVCYARL